MQTRIRRFFSTLSTRMVGQDVERSNIVHGARANSDFAALAKNHGSQGITTLGLGR